MNKWVLSLFTVLLVASTQLAEAAGNPPSKSHQVQANQDLASYVRWDSVNVQIKALTAFLEVGQRAAQQHYAVGGNIQFSTCEYAEVVLALGHGFPSTILRLPPPETLATLTQNELVLLQGLISEASQLIQEVKALKTDDGCTIGDNDMCCNPNGGSPFDPPTCAASPDDDCHLSSGGLLCTASSDEC